jgi:hypothetical protein
LIFSRLKKRRLFYDKKCPKCFSISEKLQMTHSISTLGPDPFDVIDEQLKNQTAYSADQSWAAFEEPRSRPSRPPPPRPAPPRPAPPPPVYSPKVQVDYASGRNTPSVIVKAPSSESIKSWNVTQAECLILKSNIEAIEAAGYEEAKDFDPFDTTEYEQVVAELKAKEVDPFDTSAHDDFLKGPSKTELRLIESEVLNNGLETVGKAQLESNITLLEQELGEGSASEDPFDTNFVKDILPETVDPFDTTVVDPCLLKETVADDGFDPFDTSIVETVIPVRKPKVSQRSTISIEDDDFDPSSAFKVKPAKPAPPQRPSLPKVLVDPFSIEGTDGQHSSAYKVLTPHKEVQEELSEDYTSINAKSLEIKQLEEELLNEIGGPLKRSYTDEDFDPRALESPQEVEDPDEFDPFDTSAIQIQ